MKLFLGSVNITAYDENGILEAVATKGPVSIAFEVTDDFFNYETGVYSNPQCQQDPEHVNHAVLIVGYGSENGKNFYHVLAFLFFWAQPLSVPKQYFYVKLFVPKCKKAISKNWFIFLSRNICE